MAGEFTEKIMSGADRIHILRPGPTDYSRLKPVQRRKPTVGEQSSVGLTRLAGQGRSDSGAYGCNPKTAARCLAASCKGLELARAKFKRKRNRLRELNGDFDSSSDSPIDGPVYECTIEKHINRIPAQRQWIREKERKRQLDEAAAVIPDPGCHPPKRRRLHHKTNAAHAMVLGGKQGGEQVVSCPKGADQATPVSGKQGGKPVVSWLATALANLSSDEGGSRLSRSRRRSGKKGGGGGVAKNGGGVAKKGI